MAILRTHTGVFLIYLDDSTVCVFQLDSNDYRIPRSSPTRITRTNESTSAHERHFRTWLTDVDLLMQVLEESDTSSEISCRKDALNLENGDFKTSIEKAITKLPRIQHLVRN